MKSSCSIFSINWVSDYEFHCCFGSPDEKIVSVVFQLLTRFLSIAAILVSSHPYFGRADDEDLM